VGRAAAADGGEHRARDDCGPVATWQRVAPQLFERDPRPHRDEARLLVELEDAVHLAEVEEQVALVQGGVAVAPAVAPEGDLPSPLPREREGGLDLRGIARA